MSCEQTISHPPVLFSAAGLEVAALLEALSTFAHSGVWCGVRKPVRFFAVSFSRAVFQGRVSLCNLAALRSSQPLPQRGGAGGAMQGGAGMMGGAAGGSGEDVSARKIFVRGLSW